LAPNEHRKLALADQSIATDQRLSSAMGTIFYATMPVIGFCNELSSVGF
jgi:hypothetical protein